MHVHHFCDDENETIYCKLGWVSPSMGEVNPCERFDYLSGWTCQEKTQHDHSPAGLSRGARACQCKFKYSRFPYLRSRIVGAGGQTAKVAHP